MKGVVGPGPGDRVTSLARRPTQAKELALSEWRARTLVASKGDAGGREIRLEGTEADEKGGVQVSVGDVSRHARRILRPTIGYSLFGNHQGKMTTMPSVRDLTGQQYGLLTVIARDGSTAAGAAKWRVRCRCGTEKVVRSGSLCGGTTKACGGKCLPPRIKHGATANGQVTAEYTAWKAMIMRCECKTWPRHADYGGRGITICQRWREDFANFLADMGPKPSPDLSLDRINNDGNYEPDNCRWATREEQQRNTRRDLCPITFDGITLPLAAWAERAGISRNVLRHRIEAGWTPERALKEAVRKKPRRAGVMLPVADLKRSASG